VPHLEILGILVERSTIKGTQMKRLPVLLVALATSGLTQQIQPVNGTISEALKGEDGTAIAGGTISLHLVQRASPKIVRQTTDWVGVTGTGGAFQFVGLPEGSYTLCPRVPNSTWLNPCEWNFPTPTATISRSNPNANASITLKGGAAVPIRINDGAQSLSQNEGKTPGAGLLLGISSPGFIFRLVPLVAQDSSGRDYQIVVPFNTPLTLVMHSSFYHLNDASGAALSQAVSTKIPLLIATGQKVPPLRFTVSGTGH
jgi:hypothetical protein